MHTNLLARLALALAFLSWHLVEKPFLKLKTSRTAATIGATTETFSTHAPSRHVPMLKRVMRRVPYAGPVI